VRVRVGDDWVVIVTIPNTHGVPEGVADAQGDRKFGGDVLNTYKCPFGDEEDLDHVEGNFGLHLALGAAKRRHQVFGRLEKSKMDAEPHIVEARPARTLSISSMNTSPLWADSMSQLRD
jgi:hypothetical protein